jgi:predicted ribosome quality control (RQC) complex YloA/Tae2 family protein
MNFRKMITKNNTLVLAGKNDENNEELIKQAEENEEIFHTKEPGSPFVNIKGKPKRGDIKDSAIFCAAYSRNWKLNRGNILVHRFKRKDIYKERNMKIGTFGVKKLKRIKIKKEDIQNLLKEREIE